MSDGTVNISRRIWTHEAFKDEPYTEREAWMWLVCEASWKPRKKRVGDMIVTMERGQAAASTRFCAKTWKWTDSRVRRFLERLKKLSMIEVKTDAGVNVITICKYNDFQFGGAPTDAGPTQDRRKLGTRRKKENITPLTPQGEFDLDSWAEKINGGAFVSRSTCPPHRCREMIERGLVTPEQIKARGLVA